MRRAVAAIAILTLGLGALTLWALEGREVVVLRTTGADGAARETRVWVADDEGAMWVEAAGPERPFLHDLAARPEVLLRRGDAVGRCRATVLPNPDGHARIRRLLAAKYGWADCWIGLLADTSHSLAVRLDCA